MLLKDSESQISLKSRKESQEGKMILLPVHPLLRKKSFQDRKHAHIHGDEIKTLDNILFFTCQKDNCFKVLTISNTGEEVERGVLLYISEGGEMR